MKTITRKELRAGAALYPPVDIPRPKTRGECAWCPICQEERDAISNEARVEFLSCGHRVGEVIYRSRPCVFVGCKHSLYLDIDPDTGSIKLNFPDLEPWELQHTCSLDVAALGGMTLDDVGDVMNVTRERARQIEVMAKFKVRLKGAEL